MPHTQKILMVEDSESLSAIYGSYLDAAGYEIRHSASLKEARALWTSFRPEIVLLDVELPDGNGLDLLASHQTEADPADVIIMTAYGSSDLAVQAIKAGAFDYITKPFDAERLNTAVKKVIERRKLNAKVAKYTLMCRPHCLDLMSSSLSAQSDNKFIESVAASNAPVFITGESGTGKQLTATALHEFSGRTGHLQAINCEATPPLVMESDIFGHVKGAFPGATSTSEGAAIMAHRGTLFLDEVCAMDLGVQKQLLRFMQTGEFQKVGSSKMEIADVRIICATNKNPVTEVRSGRLLEDLYYRLHVVPIELPPLRSRGADIHHIAKHLLRYYSELENKDFHSFTADAIRIMLEHPWPGNIRELQNVIHNAVALHQGSRVSAVMLARLAKSMAKANSSAAVSLAEPA